MRKMKSIKTLLGVAVIGAALGLATAPAMAADGVLLKVEVTPGSCHLQFPAIDFESSDRPVLLPSNTTDIIDFYGSCAHDPLGKDEAWSQKIDADLDQMWED